MYSQEIRMCHRNFKRKVQVYTEFDSPFKARVLVYRTYHSGVSPRSVYIPEDIFFRVEEKPTKEGYACFVHLQNVIGHRT